jgi:hypothetical protein
MWNEQERLDWNDSGVVEGKIEKSFKVNGKFGGS